MKVGIPKETRTGETRVAGTPDSVKKLIKKGFKIVVERGAGLAAGFTDAEYQSSGAEIGNSEAAFGADLVLKVQKPDANEIRMLKKKSALVCFSEPFAQDGTLEKLSEAGIDTFSVELIPRTSRAQSMDALSSQANIAGYRAVIEAVAHYGRFFPLMMTSAGSSKAAKVIVLGAGVAGLQAIATAKRLGAMVEAYDVRAEVKEQILSLGAKFIELDVGEEGSGAGGYAKELSAEAQARQKQLLGERLKKADIIITTANIPGRKAPVLVTEDAVQGMRAGSVIVDMAAGNGGNCPLSKPDQVVSVHGVKIVGLTGYPGMVPADSSNFYANNLVNLLALFTEKKGEEMSFNLNLEDDIVAGSLVVYNGSIRGKK
jgi:NAD(P) transhydrogenase subunit alpha